MNKVTNFILVFFYLTCYAKASAEFIDYASKIEDVIEIKNLSSKLNIINSSQVENPEILKKNYKDINVLICDNYFESEEFICNKDEVIANKDRELINFNSGNTKLSIFKGENFLVIPKNYLLNASTLKEVKNIINSLISSINSNSCKLEYYLEEKYFINSFSYEILNYFIFIYLSLLFLHKLKHIKIENYLRYFDFKIFTLVLIFTCFLLIYNLEIKSILRPIIYESMLFKLVKYLDIRFFLTITAGIFYIYVLLNSSFKNPYNYLIPTFFNKIEVNILKFLQITLFSVLVISTFLIKYIINFEFLIIIMSFLIFLLIYFPYNKVSFDKKEKLIVISIYFLSIVLGAYLNSNLNYNRQYKYENIFNLKNKFAFLPFNKCIKNDTKISELTSVLQFPIFVNNYLVEFPGYNKIINTDIKNINFNNSFTINTNTNESIINIINLNSKFIELLSESKPTNYVSFKKTFGDTKSNTNILYLRISYECSNKIENFYLSGALIGNLDMCDSGIKIITTTFPINLNLLPLEENKVYELKNEGKILKIELIDNYNNILYKSEFIQIYKVGNVYYVKNLIPTQDTIYNYSENIEDVGFENKDFLNTKINNLIEKNLVKNTLYIWTFEPQTLLK